MAEQEKKTPAGRKKRKTMAELLAAATRTRLGPDLEESAEILNNIKQSAQIESSGEELPPPSTEGHASFFPYDLAHKRCHESSSQNDTINDHHKTSSQDVTTKDHLKTAPQNVTIPPTAVAEKNVVADLASSVQVAKLKKALVTGGQQRRLYEWLKTQGGEILTTASYMEEALHIPIRSIRRILKKWEQQGVVGKQATRKDGTEIKLLVDDNMAYALDQREELPVVKPSLYTDRRAFDAHFPKLRASGFTIKVLQKIKGILDAAEISSEMLLESLEYAEFELQHGHMLDAQGRPVEKPLDWVYASLTRSGMYRKPKGYVSPKELVERELLRKKADIEELNRLQQELDTLEFDMQRKKLFEEIRKDPNAARARDILKGMPSFVKESAPDSKIYEGWLWRELGKLLTEEQAKRELQP